MDNIKKAEKPHYSERPELQYLDLVYIETSSPRGYFIHEIDGQYYFCSGKDGARVLSRTVAKFIISRFELRNCFLVSQCCDCY